MENQTFLFSALSHLSQVAGLGRLKSVERTACPQGRSLTITGGNDIAKCILPPFLPPFFSTLLLLSLFSPSPRHVIHTVGPRFNLRYKTAAESALYNCYRSVMQLVRSEEGREGGKEGRREGREEGRRDGEMKEGRGKEGRREGGIGSEVEGEGGMRR